MKFTEWQSGQEFEERFPGVFKAIGCEPDDNPRKEESWDKTEGFLQQ